MLELLLAHEIILSYTFKHFLLSYEITCSASLQVMLFLSGRGNTELGRVFLVRFGGDGFEEASLR